MGRWFRVGETPLCLLADSRHGTITVDIAPVSIRQLALISCQIFFDPHRNSVAMGFAVDEKRQSTDQERVFYWVGGVRQQFVHRLAEYQRHRSTVAILVRQG